VKVVVVDERNAAAVNRIDGVPVDLLQMMLARVVCRVGLSGKDDLDVPPRR
jgi:hypothetical protein